MFFSNVSAEHEILEAIQAKYPGNNIYHKSTKTHLNFSKATVTITSFDSRNAYRFDLFIPDHKYHSILTVTCVVDTSLLDAFKGLPPVDDCIKITIKGHHGLCAKLEEEVTIIEDTDMTEILYEP